MSQSHGVSRLKELLFDSESQALSELSRRIDQLANTNAEDKRRLVTELQTLTENARRERLATLERIDVLFDRVGTAERLQRSVASVIDGALRQAEVERHEDLADAVSPLVVRTVRTEIRNSRDELVEALYPMTGRMVKAYVTSAMKDLMEQVNRKLEQNPVMLRLAAIVTGRSPAELVLAETQRTEVEELYLIRRGTGELVAHWPEAPHGGNRDQVVSGVLTALNEFASEAFADDGRSLRQIDLGPSQVYLRLSPVYLLAVRCKGTPHAAIEQIIDEEFLNGLEKHATLLAAHSPAELPQDANDKVLTETGSSLASRISEKEAELAPPRVGAAVLKSLAWMIGVPLLAWITWTAYARYETDRVRSIATGVVHANEDLKGYPTHLMVEPRGRAVTISGLAPLPSAKDKVVADLRARLPESEIRDQLAVVPSGIANAEPLIRAVRKELSDRIDRDRSETSERLASERTSRERGLDAERTKSTGEIDAERKTRDDEIAALKAKLAALEARPLPVPPAAAGPTPRERLDTWTRANAIFFSNGTDYRDPEAAGRLIDELAARMKTTDAIVRVVGYTDGIGAAERNSTLSQNRAETVAAALAARGIPASRLVAIGRQNVIDIAPTQGAQSANRRVEFELGFVGETQP